MQTIEPITTRSVSPEPPRWKDAAVAAGLGLLFLDNLSAQNRPPIDTEILNYALSLEHLEAAFYNQGLLQYGSNDFQNGASLQDFAPSARANVYAYFQLIRNHENAHVRKLQSVLRSFGVTPVSPCQYRFEYANVGEFITLAQTLENTGVSAYDGVIGLIASPTLRTAAATVATVEARHAAYLNVLKGTLAAPNAIDPTRNMTEIMAAIKPFVVACNA